MKSPKIISLLPAATEIVSALGLADQLVGRSHECDFPETIGNLPICSTAKFISGSNSLQIDEQVKSILRDALSVYEVDEKRIAALQPDFIITQAQCDVCAVSLEEVNKALQNHTSTNTQVISLEPKNFNDILLDIERVAIELGVSKKGKQVVEELNERIDIIQHKLKFIDHKPSLVCIEWLEPLMTAGNWTPELVEIAGGFSLLAEAGKHSGYKKWEEILAANPDILFIMPCGFSIERTLSEIQILLSQPNFKELKAVKNNQVYVADGNQYFNRSGPRIVDSLEILAEIIHPKQFYFGYEGNGWIKFSVS